MPEYLNNAYFENLITEYQISTRRIVRTKRYVGTLRRKGYHGNAAIVRDARRKNDAAQNRHKIIGNDLAIAFDLLARNIIKSANWKLVDQDDAIQDCVLLAFEKVMRFDPERGAAFNYFSTVQWNRLKQSYRSGVNYLKLKERVIAIQKFG
jgi:Sigma-70 region 2